MKIEKTENGNIGIKMYDYPCTEFDTYLLVLSPQEAQEAARRMRRWRRMLRRWEQGTRERIERERRIELERLGPWRETGR